MNPILRSQLAVLNNMEKKLNGLYHEIAVNLGISDTALWIMHTLCDAEETYTQYDFCESWMYPRQTVNTAISYLTKAGFITLTVIPGTRNRKAITLTDSGMAIANKMLDRHHTLTRFLMALGIDERTAEQDACKMEHDISQQTYEAICTHAKTHFKLPEGDL